MKIDEAVRAWLVSRLSSVVAERVHLGTVPETSDPPYVWYARASTTREGTLDETPGTQPFTTTFDVEVYGYDPAVVGTAADLLQASNAYRGVFGTGHTAQGVFVDNQNDDYVPRGVMEDQGLHSAFFSLVIHGFT